VKLNNRKFVRMLDEHTIEVNLPNKLGYERIAMSCSAIFAKIVGFLPERVEDLKTAVSEACLNAMEHGNLKCPDKRVLVTMDYKDHVFRVSVMDQGEGMGETPEIPKNLEIERKIEEFESPRGLGMFLIKHLVDQVEYNQMTDEGHMVRMILKLTG
jgi:serine/threonine-protein kinase RsbW